MVFLGCLRRREEPSEGVKGFHGIKVEADGSSLQGDGRLGVAFGWPGATGHPLPVLPYSHTPRINPDSTAAAAAANALALMLGCLCD